MTEYPEEIYYTIDGEPAPRWLLVDEDAKTRLERAYDLGRKHAADNLDGWSNLTAAIKDGENIDWEKLDGLPAKCVHPDLGELVYKLERDPDGSGVFSAMGWSAERSLVWDEALASAWYDMDGWTLYIDGPVPIKRKTADQLGHGTGFYGKHLDGEDLGACIYLERADGKQFVITEDKEEYLADFVEVTNDKKVIFKVES